MHFAGRLPLSVSYAVAVAALVVGLAGCGAAGQPPVPPTASPAARTPAPVPGGVTLAQLGFTHGPRDFALPEAVAVGQRVDQSNVVTLVMSEPAGPDLAAWVRDQARAGGWTTTADGGDAVVFQRSEPGVTWLGAFTGGDPSGLTFRRAPG